MLQKRFASRIDGKKQFIWRYEKDAAPIELSTKDTGLGTNFYGDDDNDLENSFMEHEGRHAQLLRDVVASPSDIVEHSDAISDLMWLLAMRTESLRVKLETGVSNALEKVAGQTGSLEARAFYKREADKAFNKALKELPAPQRRFLLSAQGQQKKREARAALESILQTSLLSDFMKAGFTYVKNQVDESTVLKDSHNKGLAQLLAKDKICPPGKKPNFWKLITSEDEEFILSDSCIFAVNNQGKAVSFVGSDNIGQVYFPVDSRHTLVGIFNNQSRIISNTNITELAVASAAKYVFSNINSKHLELLVNQSISSQSEILDDETTTQLAEGIWLK